MNYTSEKDVVIIMAGGLGKRMNSDTPKVLHKVNNLPMIVHVLNSALRINPFKICIVTGRYYDHIYEMITRYITLDIIASKIRFINQEQPLGTGDSIKCCKFYLDSIRDEINNVIILSGDVPMIKPYTIKRLLYKCQTVCLLAAHVDDSYGYGRIILNNKNKFVKIVEEKECDEKQKLIKFINTGIYSFNKNILLDNIEKIDNNNTQKEYYLTYIFEIIKNNNICVDYEIIEDIHEICGINTIEQLNNLNNLVI